MFVELVKCNKMHCFINIYNYMQWHNLTFSKGGWGNGYYIPVFPGGSALISGGGGVENNI